MPKDLFIDASYESLIKHGEELCGDKVEFVRKDDYFLAVLADGLGSGVKANILSTLTSKIIATMLSNGAKLTEAVETIASTLPVCKDRGIAYSTFTIVRIERDGQVSTAEFDNPNLLVFRNAVREDIKRDTIEISGKTVFIGNFTVSPKDMMVFFSDGVVHAGVGRLLDLGWQYDNIVKYVDENILPDMPPRVLTRRLLSAVNTLYMMKPGDDSTVCSLLVKPANPVTIMVGPPVSKEMDHYAVNKLMYSKGIKVICGGTTSQIVSRVTGKDLKVTLDYENPSVPPIAVMPGVDLVTEGVLTLGKCLDIIRACVETDSEHWDMVSLNKKDGASRLAKILLDDSTRVQFIVGRALNPAHQNPGMPVSLSLKLNLIKDLASALEQLGKRVEVEYL